MPGDGTDGTSAKTCPNCGRPRAPARTPGDAPRYCEACGQELELGPLRVGEILGGALASFWSFEYPVLRTARDLLLRPGRVAREWLAGRRRRYSNPLQFLVVVGALVAILHPIVHEAHLARASAGTATYDVAIGKPGSGYFTFVCVALLVPLALLMRALGPALRVRRPWLEWYVLGTYCYAIGAALQLVVHAARLLFDAGAASTSVVWIQGLLPTFWMHLGVVTFVRASERLRALALCATAHAAALGAWILLSRALQIAT